MEQVETFTTVMCLERVVVGAAAVLTPGALLTTFGAPETFDTPAMRYTARIFGIRNIALGVQLWRARGDADRTRELATQNAAVELSDLAAGAMVTAADPQLRTAGIAVMAASVTAATGFLGLRWVSSRNH